MEKRYRALRIISTLYKIAGVIVLVFAILGAAAACLGGILGGTALQQLSQDLGTNAQAFGLVSSALGGILTGLGLIIGGGLSGLTLYATGEGIALLIAMEENTRATAMHLTAQVRHSSPVTAPLPTPPPPPPPAGSTPLPPAG
jgi:hypothetical protein